MTILGASFDTVDDNRAFAEKFNFPFLLLSDVNHEVGRAYGAEDDERSQYARRIAYLIDDGKIAKTYDVKKPADHPSQVLSDCKTS